MDLIAMQLAGDAIHAGLSSWADDLSVYEANIIEVRIGTTVLAFVLAMFALRRTFQHKRQRHFDLTAAYVASVMALLGYVIASLHVLLAPKGPVDMVRETIAVVYHLMTMLAWMLWFTASTKRGLRDDRSEGR